MKPINTSDSSGFSPVTTPIIVYDEALLNCPSTMEDNLPHRFAKRVGILPQIVLASSLIAFTTPAVSLPDLRLSGATHLSTFDQVEYGIENRRRITLREARQIALRAHYEFEEGLRIDRVQEARLMELAVDENAA